MTTTPRRGDAAPGHLLYLTDPARAAIDYTLLAYATPLLAAFPRGDNHPVLVLPRLNATDASTSTLRTVLKQLGYRTYGWRLGRHNGPTSKVVHGMRARLDHLTNRHQRPVTLIGCSLGGIYARQLARRTPQAVRQ
jgi:pimeloyl-ACP methyl ester carboxylesterase